MRRSHVSIVGAGIVGLMTAFEVSRRWPDREITVLDEGPDPRSAPNLQHTFGATYSGFDARHVSITETGPWTSIGRVALFERGPDQGGWNCLHGTRLTRNESAWLEEFVAIAHQSEVHKGNCKSVFEINRAGLDAWRKLSTDQPVLFAPTDWARRLPIVCTSAVDLHSEWAAEHALDTSASLPQQGLPQSMYPLDDALERGELHGSFLVDGSAFNVQSMCSLLIARLEVANIEFRWNARIDLDSSGELNLPPGSFVWTVGTSTAPSRLLAEERLLLQGVAGCWTSIPNRGFSQAFKLLAPEPVNFINATPVGRHLVLSGGYGWVGERNYAEAAELVAPLTRAFVDAIVRFFPDGLAPRLIGCPMAMCIRPALPSGVPAIRCISRGDRLGVICVGHAAGGFTQAPEMARLVAEALV